MVPRRAGTFVCQKASVDMRVAALSCLSITAVSETSDKVVVMAKFDCLDFNLSISPLTLTCCYPNNVPFCCYLLLLPFSFSLMSVRIMTAASLANKQQRTQTMSGNYQLASEC